MTRKNAQLKLINEENGQNKLVAKFDVNIVKVWFYTLLISFLKIFKNFKIDK